MTYDLQKAQFVSSPPYLAFWTEYMVLQLKYSQVPRSFPSNCAKPFHPSPGLHAADADDATCQLSLRGDHPRRSAHPASHPTRSKHGGRKRKRSRGKKRSTETRSGHGHRLLAWAVRVLPGRGSGQAAAGRDDRHQHDAQTGRKTGELNSLSFPV